MNPPDDPQTPPPAASELNEQGEVNNELEVPETDDPEVDKAVEEIIRKEGDEVLEAEDEAANRAVVTKLSFHERVKKFLSGWWSSPKKRWGTIAVFIGVLAVVLAVPLTRYELLGLFVREKVTVVVADSKTGAPVSGAQVVVGAIRAETDAQGRATLYVHSGDRHLSVEKKYYAGTKQTVLVSFSKAGNVYFEQLVALGRQVQVKVDNTISGKPVSGAVVSADGAVAKTNNGGTANVVLPSGAVSQAATISLSGYNETKVILAASGSLSQNTFHLTPAGQVYFLSNTSGYVDVVKSNLDGTGQQTVLTGTGDEDPQNTKLFASSDWKYLALLSKRSGNTASLYLINGTEGDKLTAIDQSDATFYPVGWSGDTFIYEVDRSSTVADWQSGQEELKSFDPVTGQTLLLDQTQGSGTSQSAWMQQNFTAVYIMGNQVVYAKGWNASASNSAQLSSQQAELDTIQADGSNHRVVKTFSLASGASINYIVVSAAMAEPNQLYLMFNDGNEDNFFVYQNGSVTTDTTLTQSMFTQTAYPTYFVSPSGNSTFWDEVQNGQDTLYIGDGNGSNQKQVMSLSSFSPYAWYTDNYLLVSQNGSGLYIMPSAGGTPFKVANYYEPSTTDKVP